MKPSSPVPCLLAFALSACGTPQSLVDLYGQPAPAEAAERTIEITPDTKHVNVEGGETVKFVVGGREFAWNFNTAATVNSFELNKVVPDGLLRHTVRAYVSPDPKYRGAPGDRDI